MNHFPFGSAGPSKIVSSVNETSDLGLNIDELSPVLFEQPNLQVNSYISLRSSLKFINLNFKSFSL